MSVPTTLPYVFHLAVTTVRLSHSLGHPLARTQSQGQCVAACLVSRDCSSLGLRTNLKHGHAFQCSSIIVHKASCIGVIVIFRCTGRASRIVYHENSSETEQSQGNYFISLKQIKHDFGIYHKVQTDLDYYLALFFGNISHVSYCLFTYIGKFQFPPFYDVL